jgi:hypothetical protein
MQNPFARGAFRTLPAIIACALALSPALAAAVPNWNVTYPVKGGHGVQKVALSATALTIDTTYPQNTAHVAIPLALIKHITEPYANNGAWAIDLQLTKQVASKIVLNVGMTDAVKSDVEAIGFLTKSDAAAGRVYLLTKTGTQP